MKDVDYGRAMDQAPPTIASYFHACGPLVTRANGSKELLGLMVVACSVDASGVVIATALEKLAESNDGIANAINHLANAMTDVANAIKEAR